MATSPNIRESLSQILSISCAVCFGTMTEPKLLDCAHTFCLHCLKILLRNKAITCPICRACTDVLDGDVTKLKTNIALKTVVEDVANLEGKCDTCGSLKPRKNLSFCSTCCKFMCATCTEKHNKDEGNSDHIVGGKETGTIRGISTAGNNPPQCANHEGVFCVSVCTECNLHLCETCLKGHIKKRHRVKSNITYVCELFASASTLHEDFKRVSNKWRTNIISVTKNEQKIKLRTEELRKAIHVEFEIAHANLKDREASLTQYCDDLKNEAVEITKTMARDTLESLSVAQSARVSTENILQSPFACISMNESFFMKNRKKARKMKDQADEGLKLSHQVLETVENLHFVKSQHQAHIPVGSLEKHTWERTDIILRSDKMTDTAIRPDGKVAVGYFDGGIELINESNSEETIMKHVKVLAIAYFPNGDLAVRDIENCLLIYDTDLKRSNVNFTTLDHYEGGEGVIVVNSASEILMSYRHVFQIHFFTKKGGQAVHVIKCVNYVPQQLVPTQNSDILVMDASVLRIIDKQGNTKSELNEPGHFGYPAVLNDGSVMIAWVKEDGKFLRIEHYTHELKSKNKILKASLDTTAKRKWYKLQAIYCDSIFFCSPNTMHYFWLNKTSVGDE